MPKITPTGQSNHGNILLKLLTRGHKTISKGDLMRIAYGDHYSNIDSAIPINAVKRLKEDFGIDARLYVMNYNDPDALLGKLENVLEVIFQKMMEELDTNIVAIHEEIIEKLSITKTKRSIDED